MQDWTFPLEDDGLFKIHNALRMDMSDFQDIAERLSSTQEVQQWEKQALAQVWSFFENTVHEHHDNEEQIFFPWIATRGELPKRLASDHVALMEMLQECAKQVNRAHVHGLFVYFHQTQT
jgi:iron-sulfur cluster repair protein YtfE (RIC family)